MKTEKVKTKSAFFKYNVKLWYPTHRMMSCHLQVLHASSVLLMRKL